MTKGTEKEKLTRFFKFLGIIEKIQPSEWTKKNMSSSLLMLDEHTDGSSNGYSSNGGSYYPVKKSPVKSKMQSIKKYSTKKHSTKTAKKRSTKKQSAKKRSTKKQSAKKRSTKKHSAKKRSTKKHSAKKHSAKKRYQKGSGVIRKRDEENEEDKYRKFSKTHHYDENKNTVTSNFSSNSSSNSIANLDNLPVEMILNITEYMEKNDDIYKLYKASERMKLIYNSNKELIEQIIMRNTIKDLEKEKDKKNMTILMLALYYKKPIKIIKLLLDRGESVNADNFDQTPLTLALEPNKESKKYNDNDLLEIVKLLLNKGAIVGDLPLEYAIIYKAPIEVIKLLLDNGANVNYRDVEEQTPLVLAITYNAPIEVIKIILDKTNDELINLEDNLDFGRTPLMHALDTNGIFSIEKNIEIIKLLLNKGANINYRNTYNFTPLTFALYYKNPIKIIKFLLDNGANVNEVIDEEDEEYEEDEEDEEYEIHGTTPLTLALEPNKESEKYNDNDLLEIVKLLLDKGANVNYIDNNKHIPLVYAIQYAPIEVIKIILDKTDYKLINLEEKKFDLGRTPLTHVLFWREGEIIKEIIKLLLNKGANINYKNYLGQTPLIFALNERSSIDTIKFLLDNGANVNDKDNKGNDVLTWASMNPIEIIQLLLDRGAKVNMKTLINFYSNKNISSKAVNLVLKNYTPS